MSENTMEVGPVNVPVLNDVVYETLRKAILRYDFEPGQRLNLAELESRLQVSRTPLKNAITRLESEGLISVQARRGTFVAEISADKVEEDFKIRSAYELYVALCLYKYLTPEDFEYFAGLQMELDDLAEQARQSGWHETIEEYLELDRDLHQRLVICGGTPRMVSLWQQTNTHMQVARLTHRMKERDFEAIHFEHHQILDALLAGSPERLNASLLNHLESSRMLVLRILSQE